METVALEGQLALPVGLDALGGFIFFEQFMFLLHRLMKRFIKLLEGIQPIN